MAYEVILYRTKSGNCPIEKHIHRLCTENKKSEVNRILHYEKYLETYGFEMSRYIRNSIKQIKGSNPKIFELRPGNNRIFFFFCDDDGSFVLLHAFEKKTQKTPSQDIKRAENEYNDYIRRKNHEGKDFR